MKCTYHCDLARRAVVRRSLRWEKPMAVAMSPTGTGDAWKNADGKQLNVDELQ